jgi:hypothetical protein
MLWCAGVWGGSVGQVDIEGGEETVARRLRAPDQAAWTTP